jgi:Eco57I restriction-modification methylase
MTINLKRTRQYLEAFDFKRLFAEELGWSLPKRKPATIQVDGSAYRLTPVAELGGMVVYTCEAQNGGEVPPVNLRKKIDKEVGKLAFEHIIIFVDSTRTVATWLWVKREPGETARAREHTFHKGQSGDLLLQKLAGIAFKLTDLDAEGRASITLVGRKVKDAFDVERVTKRFYDEFKNQHDAFVKALDGIDAATERAWYTSVMLNRLMFIYFLQKKDFLSSDPDYLVNRLKGMKKGDRFYHDFLTPLFFEGFAREDKERSPGTRQLLGRMPYLNGGLFQPHQLELAYGKRIDIPDKVFERLFAFFNEWTWHLDDRPMKAGNEINPEVLGYIFQKYINQKQMGAYYTQEDITGYSCRNTILPFLFDKLVRLRYGKLDRLPMDDVEPYIYDAVKQADFLPTETEREYAARQRRLAQIRADFKAGKIATINDLITYNLDIERFMRDWLSNLTDPATLQTFYFECLIKITVLDPTVGSGAYLFAAMNILETLYEIALDRMEALTGPKYPKFKEELARVADHPNRRYFIYKNIIINNLYGVDIMEEATEICKLRLFLKLVAQVEKDDSKPNFGIEPLPDIDFNIRAGNTLVGYASVEEVEQAATRSLFSMNLPQKIKEADFALRAFRALQTQPGISARMLAKAKADTKMQLVDIEKTLNESLAAEYGAPSVAKFVESHKPFHWYVEFNQIMQEGGFDVIVGNPPWKEYSAVKKDYTVQNYKTEPCGNLYALCIERALNLRSPSGHLGFIVQLPLVNSARMASVRKILARRSRALFLIPFDDRPGKLFEGLQHCRSVILLSESGVEVSPSFLATTRYQRWLSEARPYLFKQLEYSRLVDNPLFPDQFPKYAGAIEESIFRKVKAIAHQPMAFELSHLPTDHFIFYQEATQYWVKAIVGLPYYAKNGKVGAPAHGRFLYFKNPKTAHVVSAVLNSSLFYTYFIAYGDCFHLGDGLVTRFPIPDSVLQDNGLVESNKRLMADLKANAMRESIRTTDGDRITYDAYSGLESKKIIDEIDSVLSRHYRFTDEELDFIINYDIKYRMGRESEAE